MDDNGKEKLWEQYARTKTPELREKIITEYAPLVKLVAGRLSMYLGYNVEYEDLVSYGIFGLIDAIDQIDFNKNVKFDISVDELDTWTGQTKITNLVSLEDFVEQGSEIKMDASHNSQFEQPEKVIEKAELAKMLEKAIDELTEKERSVVLFYYYEDLSLKEISKVLEVSESRVSQLHTKAIQKMKKHMGAYMGLLVD